jgi:hypothetical protein
VKPCDKTYLYVSSLKKHIQVSHPDEYDNLVKTNKGKEEFKEESKEGGAPYQPPSFLAILEYEMM